jgi:3-phenylpropionate/cinnamic acid dioxygenase small subunit
MMTAITTVEIDLCEVEQFLYREARYADDHNYDAWEALWTDDAIYWVPAGGDDIDPTTQVSIIFDNRARLATRIKQLHTGKRHAAEPRSRVRRVVSNVELLGEDTETGQVLVGANFLLVESRDRGTQLWAGRYEYKLRQVDGQLRLASKKVMLVDNDRPLYTLAFLI